MNDWLRALLQPPVDPSVDAALRAARERVPVLWLLGKTGAGKTSIIARLTGAPEAEIGNGYEPCTATAVRYDFPSAAPVMRFLDTRGLGEIDYDPARDLAACQRRSHAVLVVARADDPDQAALCRALAQLPARPRLPALLIHTAARNAGDALTPARRRNAAAIQTALRQAPPEVTVDLPPVPRRAGAEPADLGVAELIEAIVQLVPELAPGLARPGLAQPDGAPNDPAHAPAPTEAELFARQRPLILGYAGAAGAADTVPAAGLFVVPGIQAKLLHSLAGRYGQPWNRSTTRDFIAALGGGLLYRYAAGVAGRQLGKLVPGYGQTVGAGAAAAASFGATYGLGRAACLYLYHRRTGAAVDAQALQTAFRSAFDETRR